MADFETALQGCRAALAGVLAAQTAAAAPQQTRTFQGLELVIDRPRGFVQEGVDQAGKPWRRVYHVDYGHLPGTQGGDGDELDCFVGEDAGASEVYWILQHRDDGAFDEYKCVLPGQELVGAIVGGSKSFYTGQVIKLRSALGKQLSVTPNHPVLTLRGLVPAGELKKGDHLLAYNREDELPGSGDHKQHPPTVVEEVFCALVKFHPLGVARKLVAALDFHGDAASFQGEVEVVRTYSKLLGNVVSQAVESVKQGDLIGTLPTEASLVGRRTFHACGKAEGTSGVSATGSFSSVAALLDQNFRGPARNAQPYRFGKSSDVDLSLLKSAGDRAYVDPEAMGNVLRRLPVGVAFDQIVDIECVHYSGPVFDFESTSGLIVVNRLVISNCMLGFHSLECAKAIYCAHVPRRLLGSVVTTTVEQVRALRGLPPNELAKADCAPMDTVVTRACRVVKQDAPEELRYVLGIVLEPETVDGQNELYSAEEIQQAAWRYMEHFRNVGLQHKSLVNGDAAVVESWIAPVAMELNGTQIKPGTWLMGLRVRDEGLWQQVKSGELSGLSIGGFARKTG